MRRSTEALLLLPFVTACALPSMQPRARETRGIDIPEAGLYTATFEVACDRCRVEYGREDQTTLDETDGGWTGSVPLGTIATGETVRVVLYVVPRGDAQVLSARIEVNGRTVATGKADEPGKGVTLRARVQG